MTSSENKTSLVKGLSILTLLAIGYVAGRIDDSGRSAVADVRQTPRREAFQAGDQRSEAVLKEISATLKTMDSRVARIEKTVSALPKVIESNQ